MSKEFIKKNFKFTCFDILYLFFIIQGGIIFNLFLLICFFLTFLNGTKCQKKTVIISWNFFFNFFLFSIYYLVNQYDDYSYFLFILLICISTDLGGYVVGKLLKDLSLTKIKSKKNICRNDR